MNPLQPSASLLVKLGSIAVHTEELLGPGGHHFDVETLKVLLNDQEVVEWEIAMHEMALLPVKR